jgi:hypothetical protein
MGDLERSEIALRHAGGPGNVRIEDLAASPRRDASGPRERSGVVKRRLGQTRGLLRADG